ncbi:acyl-CoA dehydrogenase family protein [Sediminibacillus massiliensis]|uniref:acyl-CoA dehydrogenase family protein n=1 Tax=Sediminibacillus massiliensis TaxID=1926277 RepID=UPI0009888D1A|nr:acyl-CoA dehydrogenase family protein [Sediminibacillus massiliensis]
MSNFYEQDPNLQEILESMMSEEFYKWADQELKEFGKLCAGPVDERAVQTDREGAPRLIRYDRMGEEVSEVWLNEGYKQTIADVYKTGIVGYIHKSIPTLGHKGGYLYSFAQGYLLSHAEPGFYCPVTLTMATAYLIDHYADKELKDRYLPHVLATGDRELYEGATFLTERQGGSDVGANQVKAVKEGDHYILHGEKYFASNAGACGVAMVLARQDGAPDGTRGLSLFLVPWEENRSNKRLRIRRLKDKLGVRAVPSAEVEFEGTTAYLVGEADRGFYYMMEALNLSRVCNAAASLGIMRRAFLEARDYANARKAFGKRLNEYPMVRETLTSLAVKQETETNALFSVIELFDKVMAVDSKASQQEKILLRLFIAIMKKETAEQAIAFSHQAIELHGGNGYIEDFVTPRLLRDAQVLTVWEGTANILGLEVLRLIHNYQADKLFLDEMNRRLENLAGDPSSYCRQLLQSKLEELAVFIGDIKQLDKHLQTYYSKRIAEKMAVIFESVIALEKAEDGQERKQAIAEIYVEKAFGPEKVESDPLPNRYFELIVGARNPVTA